MAQSHDALVIGAGPAGPLAAVTLQEAERDVLVLEARDRIGGRAYTTPLSDGTPVEHGAESIHGPTLITWEFVGRFGLRTHYRQTPKPGTPIFQRGEWLLEGEPITDGAHARVDELLSTPNSDEMSLREALVAGGLSGARLGAAEAYFSVGAAIPPEELSARNASEIWHLRDSPQDPISGVSRPGNPNFLLVDGYRRLWEELSRPVADAIRLRTPVEAVDWSPDGVVAHSAGREFKARTAIIALPVGVLQSGAVEFRPGLAELKLAAIQGIRGGGLIKVVAEFRRPWWEDVVGHVGYFRNAPQSVFHHYSAPFWDREGPPVLTAIAGNPHVKEITGDKGRVRSLFFDGLVEMFPGVDLESELVGLEVADWASDPWTMGAQSSVPVGCYQMRVDLAAPTPPLFWAGEAAHSGGHAACVHGALETGRRAAFEALHTLRPMLAGDPESRVDWWQYNPRMA